MRKTLMLLAAVAALVALGVGSAMAQEGDAGSAATDKAKSKQTIQCPNTLPCVATGRKDLVYERIGNRKQDRILLKGGSDQVRANTYRNDKDVIKGSAGFDLIYVDDGDTLDRIYGGKGNDKCYVDSRAEVVSGCSVIIPPR